jgi:hypothetical protein
VRENWTFFFVFFDAYHFFVASTPEALAQGGAAQMAQHRRWVWRLWLQHCQRQPTARFAYLPILLFPPPLVVSAHDMLWFRFGFGVGIWEHVTARRSP